MAQLNVTQFATELGVPPTQLIEQLKAAGVKKALAAEVHAAAGPGDHWWYLLANGGTSKCNGQRSS